MATALPRHVFHAVLRRNLHWLSHPCEHAAALDALAPEELLASGNEAGAVEPVDPTYIAHALDALETLDDEAVCGHLSRVCARVCARRRGVFRAGASLRAARLLHTNGGTDIMLCATTRSIKRCLAVLAASAREAGNAGSQGRSEASEHVDQHLRYLDDTLLLLHTLFIACESVPAFCVTVVRREHRSGHALVRALVDTLFAATALPSLGLPLRRLLTATRVCLRVCTCTRADGYNYAVAPESAQFVPRSPMLQHGARNDTPAAAETPSADEASAWKHSRRSSDLAANILAQAMAEAATGVESSVEGQRSATVDEDGLPTVLAPRPGRSSSMTHAPSRTTSFALPRDMPALRLTQSSIGSDEGAVRAVAERSTSLGSPEPRAVGMTAIRKDAHVAECSRRLYAALLSEGSHARWEQLFADLLALLLAAAPNLKAYTGRVDLYAELDRAVRFAQSTEHASVVLPESLRAASRSRHRDIVASAAADILVLLLKTARIGHPLQEEHLTALLDADNCCLLVLKYLAQDLGEFIAQADGSSTGVCDGSDVHIRAAKARASGQRQRMTGRRRSVTSTASSSLADGSPAATSHPHSTILAPSAVAAFCKHGVMDINPALQVGAQQSGSRRGSGFSELKPPVEPEPSDAPAPAASGHLSISLTAPPRLGLLGRSLSSPATPTGNFSSLSDDFVGSLRSPARGRRGSPTNTNRPSLDMGIVPTIVGGGPQTDTQGDSDAPTLTAVPSSTDDTAIRASNPELVAQIRDAGGEVAVPGDGKKDVAGSGDHQHLPDPAYVVAAAAGFNGPLLPVTARRNSVQRADSSIGEVPPAPAQRSRSSEEKLLPRPVLPRISQTARRAEVSDDAASTITADTIVTNATDVRSNAWPEHVSAVPWSEASSSTGWPLHGSQPGALVDPNTGEPLSRRRASLIVALLRILRIVTKRHPERVKEQLVKYKSQLVLVRAVSSDCVPIVYYALKSIKAQVRYLGMWKRRNMQIVTAIYHFVPPRGKDEWLATPGLLDALLMAKAGAEAGAAPPEDGATSELHGPTEQHAEASEASGVTGSPPGKLRSWAMRTRGRGRGGLRGGRTATSETSTISETATAASPSPGTAAPPHMKAASADPLHPPLQSVLQAVERFNADVRARGATAPWSLQAEKAATSTPNAKLQLWRPIVVASEASVDGLTAANCARWVQLALY